MKTKYIISVFLLVLGMSVIGQTVYTPWGTIVSVWTPQDDMIPSQRDQMDQDHSDYEDDGAYFHNTLYGDSNYPWPSSTSKFNCHGYAWYMYWRGSYQEFNAPWNMNTTEADNYFTDPSFIECTKSEADIWWINGGTHSAVATSVTDRLKSKWGTGPLATHHKDNQPNAPIYSVNYYKVCLYEATGDIYSDITMDYCAVKLTDTSVSNYVDLEIEYEKGVLINGPFSTGSGSTLYFHPN